MRALDPEVFDAIWAAVEPLLPTPPRTHPLGCHRRRASARTCFKAILIRLVTGCSWVDAEALIDGEVSDTTLRARRDEWVEAGVFDALVEEALSAYDKIVSFDFREAALDGSPHKAPSGGEATGPNPFDRGRCGWKWSVLTDTAGIPFGWSADGAHRHDVILFDPTIEAAVRRGLASEVESLHLDRGYDSAAILRLCAEVGIGEVVITRQRRKQRGRPKLHRQRAPRGLRWPVERTNAWLANFGQLRRNTDRRLIHRLAQLALAITLLITAKLIDWRNRWSPASTPIR
jgi:transposase